MIAVCLHHIILYHNIRAFWAYHDKFPSQGRRLLDSLDTQIQKHLNDEKAAMQKGSHLGLVHGWEVSPILNYACGIAECYKLVNPRL